MTRKRVAGCIFVVASSLAGCTGTGDVEYAGEVRVTSPELIEISPGVQVIADADEPIFYSHGAYWLYRDGYWFRSHDYHRGYARIEFTSVPTEVRVIERPQLYVHYRSNYGRTRAARTPTLRQRSQPTYQQRSQPVQQAEPAQPAQPTYPPPAAQQLPSQNPAVPPTSPTSPVYQPHTPDTPGTEPGQANPPGLDRSTNTVNPPGNSGSAPGQANRPQARSPSAPPPANDNKQLNPNANAKPSDRSDAATPPSTNNTDDRTKKADEKNDKNKSDK